MPLLGFGVPISTMESFETAIDYVTQALRVLERGGAGARASAESLQRLARAASGTVTPRPIAVSTEGGSTGSAIPRTAALKTEVAAAELPVLARVASFFEAETATPARKMKAVLPFDSMDEPPPLAVPLPVVRGVASDFSPLPVGRVLNPSEKARLLDEMRSGVLACTKCAHLVESRTQVVFGVGNPDARLVFVGEAPGEEEDKQGEPFVGKSGQMLTKIIDAMGLSRGEVYIANVLKCHPATSPGASGNRKPERSEMDTCLPYLERQLEIIHPLAIVTLGLTAAQGLLGPVKSMEQIRGQWRDFKGISLMCTSDPFDLLRSKGLGKKRVMWEDLLQVMERLEMPISDKQRGFFLSKG